jgi:hypothetical protein
VGRWRAAGHFGRRHRGHDRRPPLAVRGPVSGPWHRGAGRTGLDVAGASRLWLVALGIFGVLRLRVADRAVGRHHPVGAAGPVSIRLPEPGSAVVRAPERGSGRIVGAGIGAFAEQVGIGVTLAEQVGISVTFAEQVGICVTFAVALAVGVTVAFALAFAVIVGTVDPAAIVLGSVDPAAIIAGTVDPSAFFCGSVICCSVICRSVVCGSVVCGGRFAVLRQVRRRARGELVGGLAAGLLLCPACLVAARCSRIAAPSRCSRVRRWP